MHIDNSLEFGKACKQLSWNRGTSTPHRSETNGIAERAARRIKEETSAVLLQSGFNEKWWADSMECFRFGEPVRGPVIPFGSMIECHPISARDQSRLYQFGKNILPGMFSRYALCAGGIWNGDILVADVEELEKRTSQKSLLGDSMQRKSSCRKW